MSLKCKAVKITAHDDFLSVYDDHDDKFEFESDFDSAVTADTVSTVQCHFKHDLQDSSLHQSVAVDNLIVINTSSAFKLSAVTIKDALHSASSASHFTSSVLHFKTFIFTSFCSSHCVVKASVSYIFICINTVTCFSISFLHALS